MKGEGNQQDYGMRVYDPRVGRFLSVDPLTEDYPWYTPYQFAGNKPIVFVDLDGLEEQPVYTDGKYWITPDQDGHNGGIWKKYSKEENVGGGKDKRDGTYDKDLKRVGD